MKLVRIGTGTPAYVERFMMGLRGRVTLGVLFLSSLTPMLAAQSPTLKLSSPQAVQPGATTTLKLVGGDLQSPTHLWSSFPAEAVLTPNLPNNGTNPAEVTYNVKVPADAPPGLHGIRVATARGASPLLFVFVDDLKSVPQVKPNNEPAKAQALTLPCAVDGTQDNLARGYYKFTAAAGQKLTIEVWARRFGSPFDPFIKLMDAKGKELAYSDDTPGLNGDSRLTHQFATAGEYLLEVRDIRFQGGDAFKYRLRIGEFPTVSVPYPLSAPMGETTTVSFTGKDVAGVVPASLNIPASTQSRWMNVGAKYDKGTASGFATLGISRGKEFLEQEPNDETAQANKVPLGQNLNGRFEKERDIDRFTFPAKKGETYLFQAYTHAQGSPADLRMRLLKADGNQLAAAEELNPSQDGRIQFTFPEDGNYTLAISDCHGRSGPEYAYRVEVHPATSPVELSTSADTINIGQEGIALLTVNAKRNGFGGPIPLRLSPAIEGIRITNPQIPAGKDSALITILNEGGTSQGKCLPLRLVADIPDAAGKPVEVTATISDSLRTAHNAIPHPPGVLSQEFALGIAPRPAYVLRTTSTPVVLGKGLSSNLRVKALRTSDFNEPITLEVFPKDKGLPDGVTIAVKPIDKDQNSVELVVSGNDKAPLGTFMAVLQGTAKRGNETIVQPVAAIELTLREAFTLKDAGQGKIVPGGELKFPVQIERNPAFHEPLTVTVANLPKGVTVAPLTIPADATSGILTLTAAKETAKGTPAPLKLKAEGTANKVKHEKTLDLKLVVE